MIKRKVGEYLDRAEKLKDHIDRPDAKDKPAASAAANGVGSGGKAKYDHVHGRAEANIGRVRMLILIQRSYGAPCLGP